MSIEITFHPVNILSPEAISRIDEVDRLAYAGQSAPAVPGATSAPIQWAKADFIGIGVFENLIVCQLAIVQRVVSVNHIQIPVAGVGGVATHPAFQRRGFAGQLLEKAAAFMRDDLQVPFGLLVCNDRLADYYRTFHWSIIQGPMFYDYYETKKAWHENTMVLPLSHRLWPEGLVDLNGLPW